MKRVIWIVLDSVGMGAMEDAASYGDENANTLAHVYTKCKGLDLKNMIKIGLGNIEGMKEIPKSDTPLGSFARLAELSSGKDTTTGHWEMIGVHTKTPFPTYPNGFPEEIIKTFEDKIGRKVLGNYPASGTVIMEELGGKHIKTGFPIVYTSADSVFQIAAHEEIIPLNELYEICEIARNLLIGEHEVARVIARPFVGEEGSFMRTANRRDYAIAPPKPNLLSLTKQKNVLVAAVGKIEDIFAKEGITYAKHTKNNLEGIHTTLEYMKECEPGIIFTNLVDFDMKWGHRNNYIDYGKGLEEFDKELPNIINGMKEEDILIITADHGCDPTIEGTDHTREFVPLLVFGHKIKQNNDLGTRKSFADIGQTVAEYFNLPPLLIGRSFLKDILK